MMKLKTKSFVYGWVFGLLFLHIIMTIVSLGFLIVKSFREPSNRLGTAIFILSFFIISYLLILLFRWGINKIFVNSEMKVTTFREDIIRFSKINFMTQIAYFLIIIFSFMLMGYYLDVTMQILFFS